MLQFRISNTAISDCGMRHAMQSTWKCNLKANVRMETSLSIYANQPTIIIATRQDACDNDEWNIGMGTGMECEMGIHVSCEM